MIPGLGRSPGEGKGVGYPSCYSWVSLVTKMVKNLPAMQETWVRYLGWEDPLEEGMATHPSILAGESTWTEKPVGCSPWDRKEYDATEQLSSAQHGNKNFIP